MVLFGECLLRYERYIWLVLFCIFCSGCSLLILVGILLYFFIMVVEGGYLIEFLIEKDNLDLFFVYLMCLLIEGRWCIFFKIIFVMLCKVGV